MDTNNVTSPSSSRYRYISPSSRTRTSRTDTRRRTSPAPDLSAIPITGAGLALPIAGVHQQQGSVTALPRGHAVVGLDGGPSHGHGSSIRCGHDHRPRRGTARARARAARRGLSGRRPPHQRVVRASALAHLRLPLPGQLLWDVGTGAGSIAVEWCRAADGARAIGVERRADRASRGPRQRRAAHSRGCLPPGRGPAAGYARGASRPDAVFVGGGGTMPEAAMSALRSTAASSCGVTVEPSCCASRRTSAGAVICRASRSRTPSRSGRYSAGSRAAPSSSGRLKMLDRSRHIVDGAGQRAGGEA